MDFSCPCLFPPFAWLVPGFWLLGARLADWRLWEVKAPIYRLRWASSAALAHSSTFLCPLSALPFPLPRDLADLLDPLVDDPLASIRLSVLKLCSGSCWYHLNNSGEHSPREGITRWKGTSALWPLAEKGAGMVRAGCPNLPERDRETRQKPGKCVECLYGRRY
jgi:hypothetical protein